jgi:hypothetical protein
MENKIRNLINKYKEQIKHNHELIYGNSNYQLINASPEFILQCSISQFKLLQSNKELEQIINDLQILLM